MNHQSRSKGQARRFRQVFGRILPFQWFDPLIAIALLSFGCGGAISERNLGAEKEALSDAEFVASVKAQIDDQVTYEDAADDIERVRGKVVKWRGDIVIIWNDKLLIASPSREGDWNHSVLMIDHPLPQDTSVEDLKQTVSTKEGVYVLGRIVDLQTVVLETGSDLTIPHLECYVISKDNDRTFSNPVWVGNK